jgi:hypothetical protein
MVDVTTIQTFYHEFSGKPKVFTHLDCLFIYIFSGKIFSYAAVVCVTEFAFVILVVEQIVDVYIVDIALNCL